MENKMTEKKMMNITELSEYTGLSVGYIYQLTSKRKLPFYKPFGKVIFFKKDEVDEVLFSDRKKTSTELDTEAINILLSK